MVGLSSSFNVGKVTGWGGGFQSYMTIRQAVVTVYTGTAADTWNTLVPKVSSVRTIWLCSDLVLTYYHPERVMFVCSHLILKCVLDLSPVIGSHFLVYMQIITYIICVPEDQIMLLPSLTVVLSANDTIICAVYTICVIC